MDSIQILGYGILFTFFSSFLLADLVVVYLLREMLARLIMYSCDVLLGGGGVFIISGSELLVLVADRRNPCLSL
jgi:hypothetical protein